MIVDEELRFWGEYQAIFIPLSAAPGISIDVELYTTLFVENEDHIGKAGQG